MMLKMSVPNRTYGAVGGRVWVVVVGLGVVVVDVFVWEEEGRSGGGGSEVREREAAPTRAWEGQEYVRWRVVGGWRWLVGWLVDVVWWGVV